MMQLLVQVAYPGAAFHGSAWQPQVATVAGALLARLRRATSAVPYALSVAARTDAGVSAAENFFTLRLPSPSPEAVAALVAPAADRLAAVAAVALPRRLMARNLPRARTYRYRLSWRRPPAQGEPVWSVAVPLAIAPMQQALLAWLGEHDFSPWARRRAAPAGGGRCALLAARAAAVGDHDILIELTANRFLRHMARRLAMTLAEVGAGLRDPEEPGARLRGASPWPAAPSAPAVGLCLHHLEVPTALRAALAGGAVASLGW